MSRDIMFPTLAEFYVMCKYLDWYAGFSDDWSVVRQGEEAARTLQETARRGGQVYVDVYEAWHDHMFSGEPWGTERAPRPSPPHDDKDSGDGLL